VELERAKIGRHVMRVASARQASVSLSLPHLLYTTDSDTKQQHLSERQREKENNVL